MRQSVGACHRKRIGCCLPWGTPAKVPSCMASIGVPVESASCAASILFRRFLQGKCTFRLDSMDAFRVLGQSLRQQACDQGFHVSKKKRGRRCASEIHTISYSRAFRVSKTYEIVWMNVVQGPDARNRIKASLREDAREGFFTRGLEWRVGLARRGLRKGASGV